MNPKRKLHNFTNNFTMTYIYTAHVLLWLHLLFLRLYANVYAFEWCCNRGNVTSPHIHIALCARLFGSNHASWAFAVGHRAYCPDPSIISIRAHGRTSINTLVKCERETITLG